MATYIVSLDDMIPIQAKTAEEAMGKAYGIFIDHLQANGPEGVAFVINEVED